jgi:plasmid stability protein
VKQLITRIDDQLHRQLKALAAREGRSVNALVTDLLSRGVSANDERATVRARAETAGLRVEPELDRKPPSRRQAIAATRGSGRAASEALASDRLSR